MWPCSSPVCNAPMARSSRKSASTSEVVPGLVEVEVAAALMEADVTALAGPKGRHDGARTAVRHGRERGSVTLGGRRVPVTRPRVRAADGSAELSIASYE